MIKSCALKILVIKLSALGDVVHAVPAVNAIKAARPNTKIDWLINDSFKTIIENQSSINKIFALKNKKLATYIEMAKILKAEDYDIIIDLQGLIKTASIAFFAKTKKTKIIGYKEPREKIATYFYSEKVDAGENLDNSSHVIEKTMLFAEYLGANLQKNDSQNLILDYGELRAQGRKPRDGELNVCLVPSTTWESKLWLAEAWAEIIENFIFKLDARVHILGTDYDASNIQKIYEKLDAKTKSDPKLINLLNQKSLRELPEFFNQMDFILGVDTGPLHIAVASVNPENTKILGLYGPTSSFRTGPYAFNSVNYSEMIGHKVSHKRNIKDDRHSMALIKPMEIFEISRGLLNI